MGCFFLLRLGYVQLSGFVLSSVLWAGFTLPMFNFGGMHDTAITGYFVVIILAAISIGRSGLLTFGLVCALSIVAVFVAERQGH